MMQQSINSYSLRILHITAVPIGFEDNRSDLIGILGYSPEFNAIEYIWS